MVEDSLERRIEGRAIEVLQAPLAALEELIRRFPHIKDRLFTQSGEVHRHINALKNGENVSFKKGFATALHEGDRLTVLPPVGGG